MTDAEALNLVKSILAPDGISHVQEIVFRYSWEGRLYPQIAEDAGYHPEYIRDVGAQLWRSLSTALGQKVTKKNIRYVLTHLPPDLRVADHLASTSSARTDQTDQSTTSEVGRRLRETASAETFDMASIAFPSVAVPLQSQFYILPHDVEAQARAEIAKPSGLLRLRAPGNRGKTSLMLRLLDYARQQEMRTVLLNFQEAEAPILTDLGRFLRWFSLNVTQQLGLASRLDDYWDDEIGHKVSCKLYFREYLLKQFNQSIVLALDEVDQIFEYAELVQEFFPMLRVWHEEGMELSVWQNLRLVLSYNTEVYVPLKLSQSPFNLGLALALPLLTLADIQTLALQYGLPWEGETGLAAVQSLHDLVGGHPYLIQLALYALSQSGWVLADLLAAAPTQAGVYSGHLRQHWRVLERQPQLVQGLSQVVASAEGAELDAMSAYRLESLGLVSLRGNQARISCELYRRYFKSLLQVVS
ncbi:MAG: AAA-like domain-containing protein [Cyanobacteria bacterium J06632_22]